MDRRNTNNELVNSNVFEYSFPICDDGDESGGDSNKSTPYYTPLESFQSSFEFPSPKPIDKSVTPVTQVKQESYTESVAGLSKENMDMSRSSSSAQARQLCQSGVKQTPSTTSPAVSRKIRRFSLYERRSCSPQNLLSKNAAGSVDLSATELPSPVDDKENARPFKFFDQSRDEIVQAITRSGNSSPIILKDECGSPKIPISDGMSRHNFSPKLLASINNLKLANSPLGVISSAGYKNGNYFKFPEIDNVVQEHSSNIETTQEATSQKQSNFTTMTNKSRFISASLDSSQTGLDSFAAGDSVCTKENLIKSNAKNRGLLGNKNESLRKNRKNTNDLTFQITDTSVFAETAFNPSLNSPSPSPAKPKTPTIKSTKEKALSLDSAGCDTSLSIVIHPGDSQTHLSCDEIDSKMHFTINNSGNSSQLRQRNVGSRERLLPTMSASTSKPTICSSASSSAVYRNPHKPSPLFHSSNTNLKTVPEFLTFEFSTSSPEDRELSSFKQKSMDLPNTIVTSTTSNIRTKSSASGSGTLLQRRGSNHSLILNLHGSCSNLLGTCSGLSVSNCSLGSAANSTTNLNIKSSCNPEATKKFNLRQASEGTGSTLQHNLSMTTQGTKQTLFRERGSNQSLTLKNSATSCGNLNSLASQNSLNVDRGHMHIPGVTRTTSFITPTQHTTSNATTPKRCLLERRGSNQSLSLGIGAERINDKSQPNKGLHPQYCPRHHRKFFSSENLNKPNTQPTDDMSQTDYNVASRPFGSASDLKASGIRSVSSLTQNTTGQAELNMNIEEDSNICFCTGKRNIMTQPLSPTRVNIEFKNFVKTFQTLQGATNVLKQHDLIKLNYIFDNSYASSSKILQGVLPIVLGIDPSSGKETGTPTGTAGGSLATTSEDCEITARYEEAVKSILDTLQIDIEEQKRIFCDLHKEFWDLPLNEQTKSINTTRGYAKNRYEKILPNESTRFRLEKECMQAKFDGNTERNALAEKEGIDARKKINTEETLYINANYIKGPDTSTPSYVATQGPLPSTIFDFWLMVYQNTQKQNSINLKYYQKIVMLTNFEEEHKQKCAVYFPIELNEIFIATSRQEVLPNKNILNAFFENYLRTNDDFQPTDSKDAIESFQVEEIDEEIIKSLPQMGNCFVIKNVGIVRKNGFSIRKMIVLYCQREAFEGINDYAPPRLLIQRICCYHYWYPDWPDHCSPRDINTFLDMCLHILNLGKCEAEFDSCGQLKVPELHIAAQTVKLYNQDLFNSLQPLPIIHCSAGVGRTGCTTAILNGIRQMRQALASSLLSMAAELFIEKNTEAGQLQNPNDFHLPHEFCADYMQSVLSLECNNDTDSSFTRSTILYISFIAQMQKEKKSVAVETVSDSDSSKTLAPAPPTRKVLSLLDLPRMPNITVDILAIVCNLRLNRGCMVQNSVQYELIHRALCLYLKRTFALKRF